jgi:hypothetical protein
MLKGDGEILDTGKSTDRGAWALHVTVQEAMGLSSFTVTAKRMKIGPDKVCGAAHDTDTGSGAPAP